jgi:hypothetical protein
VIAIFECLRKKNSVSNPDSFNTVSDTGFFANSDRDPDTCFQSHGIGSVAKATTTFSMKKSQYICSEASVKDS